MTKKEELIDFISSNMTDTVEIIVIERVHEIPYESFIKQNVPIEAHLGIDIPGVIEHIELTYSDDLYTTTTKGMIKEILYWYTDNYTN